MNTTQMVVTVLTGLLMVATILAMPAQASKVAANRQAGPVTQVPQKCQEPVRDLASS